jgi:hypothetical protein
LTEAPQIQLMEEKIAIYARRYIVLRLIGVAPSYAKLSQSLKEGANRPSADLAEKSSPQFRQIRARQIPNLIDRHSLARWKIGVSPRLNKWSEGL